MTERRALHADNDRQSAKGEQGYGPGTGPGGTHRTHGGKNRRGIHGGGLGERRACVLACLWRTPAVDAACMAGGTPFDLCPDRPDVYTVQPGLGAVTAGIRHPGTHVFAQGYPRPWARLPGPDDGGHGAGAVLWGRAHLAAPVADCRCPPASDW